MRLLIMNKIIENEITLMRKIGYHPHENYQGKLSFVRFPTKQPFPRFHIYLATGTKGLFLNMHFDAKRESYEAGRTHSLEKESEGLTEEAGRIYQTLRGDYSQIFLVKS